MKNIKDGIIISTEELFDPHLICEKVSLVLVVERVVGLAGELVGSLVEGEFTVEELHDCS